MRELAPPPVPRAPAGAPSSCDDWVRTVREANGLSTAELASILDVPVWRVEHWEHDRRLPNGRKVRDTLNHFAQRAGLPTR